MKQDTENRFLEIIIEKAEGIGSSFIIANSVTLNHSILYCSVQLSVKVKFSRSLVLKEDAHLNFLFGKQTSIHSIERYKEAVDLSKRENVEMVLYDASGFKAWYLVSTVPVFNQNLEKTLILVFFNEIGHLRKFLYDLDSPKTKWRKIAKLVIEKNELKSIVEKNVIEKKMSIEEMISFYNKMYIPLYGSEKVKLPLYIISQNHILKKCWDFFIAFIMVYTATVLPFCVCFKVYTKVVNVMDTIFDTAFLVDIGLNFFTTYVDKKGGLVTDLKKIKVAYLKGFFPLHVSFGLLCWISSLFCYKYNSIEVVQVLLLIRLFRLSFVPKKLANYLDNNIFTLVFWMIIFFMCAHWLACIWYLIGFQIDVIVKQDNNGWLSNLMNKSAATLMADGKGPPLKESYVTALYFAVTILSTCGFGNSVNTGNTLTEKCFAIFAMVFSCVLYAFIFGKVNNIIVQLRQEANEYSTQLNAIQHFIRTYKVPQNIGSRLKDYFTATWTVTKGANQEKIMNIFPRDLQSDLCLCIHKNVLEKQPCFKNMSKKALQSVSRYFWVLRTPPGDILVTNSELVNSIYFVVSGAFEVNCKEELIGLIGPGDSFGQRIVEKPTVSTCEVKATSYGIVHSVHVEGLFEALSLFPEELNKLKYTLKLSIDITKKKRIDKNKVKDLIFNNWATLKNNLNNISSEAENEELTPHVEFTPHVELTPRVELTSHVEFTPKLKTRNLSHEKIQQVTIELNKIVEETSDSKTNSGVIITQRNHVQNILKKRSNKVDPEIQGYPNELNRFKTNTDKYFFANGNASV